MSVTDPIVLPADVVLVPIGDLSPELLADVEHGPGDVAVTRPLSRTPSSIVDARTAALLRTFREPHTIVDAIISLSADEGSDPRATLEEAMPTLASFVNAGLLVPADSALARPIEASCVPGDKVGGLRVARCVHVLVDTEVYLARAADGGWAALKIARIGCERAMAAALAHEAAILEHLDGDAAPRLLSAGIAGDRPFLATAWCPGTGLLEAAADEDAGGRLALADAVLAAYSTVHRRGVLHGDVHPRNVLVDGDRRATLIDFGIARGLLPIAGAGDPPRGGIDLFMEPEHAIARRSGHPPPPLSTAGEQYAVAAMLHMLFAGAHTHDFSLEEPAMLRQLAEDPPATFEHRGVHGLHEVEAVLGRALAKQPQARFASIDALRHALAGAASAPARPGRRGAQPGPADRVLDSVVERIGLDGPLLAEGLAAPTASVQNGAAGLAYAALRIAQARDDEHLLALADVWAARAADAIERDEAFWNAELEITPELFERSSVHHGEPGVWLVHALLADALGDRDATIRAAEAFVAAARPLPRSRDVAFGLAGTLLGCVVLLGVVDHGPVRTLGVEAAERLWGDLAALGPLADDREVDYLGAAHGWAGMLYALQRFADAAGQRPPAGLDDRLAELAALAEPIGRGVRWARVLSPDANPDALWSSWCNGSPGHAFLWAHAGGPHLALAERCAWSAWEAPESGGDLCCGLAGRAYAALAVHHATGDEAWLRRARLLADRAAIAVATGSMRRDALYKGEVGVALLAAELAVPDDAAMPLF
jgi:serine/threonine-protein kinase